MRKIYVLTATLALSSCGIYTNYHQVEDVPSSLYGEEVQIEDSVSMADLSWRELFTDSTLQTLIEKGLENNTDLQGARLRVEQSEAALLAAKLSYLPSFAFAPQGTVSSFDMQAAAEIYQIPVVASWQIDIFGGIRNAKKQAKAVYEQSRDYQQAVHAGVICGIANLYYTLRMLDEQLTISQDTELSWEETVVTMRAMKDAGMANEAAVAQLEAAYLGVKASVLDLKEQINAVENALALILAETPQHIERTSWKVCSFEVPEHLSVGVPVQMLANRPDVRAAEHALEAAFYGTNAARSAFYPNISLSGSAGWTNSVGATIINPGKLLAAAVASLTQPIFAQGQLQANYKVSKAQQEQAALTFRQTVLNAGAEVNEAMVAYETSSAKSALIADQVTSLQKAYESTSLLMQHGNITYLDVLTTRQALLGAKLQQSANHLVEIQSVISLYQALGGGS